ncbi:hypothetical protein HU200_012377 [Digitaria exilis]|uniref:Kinesin-like protein n=1 Tax=Digitaria exilis TaxID=1010633 RepID=A0A835KKJ5_9POAL|nr:hypothetical protein HU200_012377 [Digitaria exilis]
MLALVPQKKENAGTARREMGLKVAPRRNVLSAINNGEANGGTPSASADGGGGGEAATVVEFSGREDVERLLAEKMKGKNKTDYKGRVEQMSDYIKKLRACIRWYMELEDGYLAEQEKLQGAMDAENIRHSELEAQLSNAIEELKAANLDLTRRCEFLEESLNREKSEKLVRDNLISLLCHKLISDNCYTSEFRVKEELRKEVECLRAELKQVRDDRDHSVAQVNNLSIELADCKEQIGKYSKECISMSTKVSALELADVTAIEAMTGYEEQKEKIKYLEERLSHAESQIVEGDELRKKLHNTILELKGNIRVFCRVRPLLRFDGDSNGPEGASISFPTSVESAGRAIDLMNQGQKLSFSYDKVFDHNASQEDVFVEISQLVQSALDGYKVLTSNCSMMCCRIVISVHHASMLEIYNETIRDLLAPGRSSNFDMTPSKQYTIKHDSHGNTTVSDLTIIDVFGIADVTHLLEKASQSRSVGKTQMNEQSSRSHFVFTLKISGSNETTGQQSKGSLNLIDLAGSERLLKVVPQPCLGGDSKTLMFVNISPEASSVGETICSLRFASRVNACEIGIPRRQTQARSFDSRLSYG